MTNKLPLFKLKGIYIEITSHCNRCCPYCYNDSGLNGTYINEKVFYDLVDSCVKNNVKNITISGGEPFLHPGIYDFINYANKRNIHTLIITNLSLVSSDKIIELLKAGNSVQITLDFPDERNDITRGKGSFNLTYQLLQKLKEQKLQKGVVLRMNVSKQNINYIQDMIEFSLKLNLKEIVFSLLAKSGRSYKYQYVLDYNEDIDILSQYVIFLQNKKRDLKQKINITYNELENQRGCIIFSEEKSLQCVPRVDPKGDVYFCSFFMGKENSIGNIKDEKIDKIINSEKMHDFIKKVRQRVKNENCKNCLFNKICCAGCPALSYMNNGNLSDIKDQCSMIKFFIKNKIKEQSKT